MYCYYLQSDPTKLIRPVQLKLHTWQLMQSTLNGCLKSIQPRLILQKRCAAFWLSQICQGMHILCKHPGCGVCQDLFLVKLLLLHGRQECSPPAESNQS